MLWWYEMELHRIELEIFFILCRLLHDIELTMHWFIETDCDYTTAIEKSLFQLTVLPVPIYRYRICYRKRLPSTLDSILSISP